MQKNNTEHVEHKIKKSELSLVLLNTKSNN